MVFCDSFQITITSVREVLVGGQGSKQKTKQSCMTLTDVDLNHDENKQMSFNLVCGLHSRQKRSHISKKVSF